jgi:tripartite-type tricarboxylate transporter receptor subunit TctC
MGLLFSKIVGVQMTHVPYKGSPQALTDLVAGRISLMFPNIPAVSSYLKSGKLRPIAVTSLERSPALPEIPTFNELGFKGFEVLAWYGVFAPANLPAEIQAKLCDAINRVLKDPDARKRITSLGFDAAGGSSANFKEFVRKEVERWSGVIKEAGVAPAN